MPGRSFSSNSYRFGFNGQEKDNEIGEGIYTAEYWEYDSRLGRRWNQDPKPNPSISNYACFANNPIFYADPLGDALRGRTGGDAQKMLGDMRNIFGADSKIFDKLFTLGEDGQTFNKIGSVKEFNKFLNRESGFSSEQKALANGLMKMINAGYSVDVSYDQEIDLFEATSASSGIVELSNAEKQFADVNGNIRTSTQTQRFVHEVLGEAFLNSNTGDGDKTWKLKNDASSPAEADRIPFVHKMNLQIIQAENIYNRMNGFSRSGVNGLPGSHGLSNKDIPNVGKVPAPFTSSFYKEGDWSWEYLKR